jgi:crossover junction endodeoxyribonuclease RuvC
MILALDLATITGYALGDHEGIKLSGARRMPDTGADLYRFGSAFRHWLTTGLERHRPDRVAFEQPILSKETQLVTCRKLYGLAYHTELICGDLAIPCGEVNMSDWRKHFLGKGYPRKRKDVKAAVMARCRDRGFKFSTDDEAEAIAILDYVLSCENPNFALGATPLFQDIDRPFAASAKDVRTAALRRAAGLQ